jgi:hypothetical protein
MKQRRQIKTTPRDATNNNVIAKIPRDNVATHEHWMIIGHSTVTLAAQKDGQASKAEIEIPRRTFNAFIDWYNTGVWRQPRR